MLALLHHLPFEQHDPYRNYELEVRIGGEIFKFRATVPTNEVRGNPRFTQYLKRQLVGMIMKEWENEIYNQIGLS